MSYITRSTRSILKAARALHGAALTRVSRAAWARYSNAVLDTDTACRAEIAATNAKNRCLDIESKLMREAQAISDAVEQERKGL